MPDLPAAGRLLVTLRVVWRALIESVRMRSMPVHAFDSRVRRMAVLSLSMVEARALDVSSVRPNIY